MEHRNQGAVPASSKMDSGQEPPNRRQFERALSRLTNEIDGKEQQLKLLLGHGSPSNASSTSYVPGEINRIREESKRCRRDRERYRQEFMHFQQRTDDLKKQLANKRHEISGLEENLLFRNEQKLAERLRRCQEFYDEGKCNNIREEQAIVQEIDKLKRNEKCLKKLKTLYCERDALDGQLKTIRTMTQECSKKIKDSKRNEEGHKATLRQSTQNVSAMKKELNELFNRKRQLIQEYNEKKHSFIEWRRVHPAPKASQSDGRMSALKRQTYQAKLKRKVSGPGGSGGFITSGHGHGRYVAGDDSGSDSDGGGDFELFFEEKRSCRNLMSYLQKFLPSTTVLGQTLSVGSGESEGSSILANHPSLSNASSSAEEQQIGLDMTSDIGNEGLVILKKEDECNLVTTCSGIGDTSAKRRSSKKEKLRKNHQSVSYDPYTLSLFDTIAVTAPLSVHEVPGVIENLKEKLKYFEDQTRMPPDTSSASYWYTTYGLSTTDRMISSESEMTTDSARFSYVTPSDLDDSTSTSGLLSPECSSGSILPSSMSLVFDPTNEGIDATTPLATSVPPKFTSEQMKMAEKLSPVEEGRGEIALEQNLDHLSRVPTYDEGFADLMTDATSKDSSTGGTTAEEGENLAASGIFEKLENIQLKELDH